MTRGEPGAAESAKFAERRRRPRWGALALVVLFHLLAIIGLVRAFAPQFANTVIERATSLVTVTIATPPAATPSPTPEGAAAEQGRKATPKPVTAPTVPRPTATPAPRASSTGTASSSGAGGAGAGTGSGQAGSGSGGAPVTKPVKIAGDIDDARDYPTPPGGRQIRWGHSVTVYMTVGVDGRASNCRVVSPSPDPEADRITCELAVQRFRFKPAMDADGNPVPATYGWRQSWFTR